jgi:hypothetical protein
MRCAPIGLLAQADAAQRDGAEVPSGSIRDPPSRWQRQVNQEPAGFLASFYTEPMATQPTLCLGVLRLPLTGGLAGDQDVVR